MRLRSFGLWTNTEFLKLWAAQTMSFGGSQLTLLALPLLAVITLHASATEMGLLRTLNLLPALFIGIFVGTFLDRRRRRPILIVADVGRAFLFGSIPLASYLGVLHMRHLYLVAFLGGMLTMVFDIAHTSLLPTLVAREYFVEGNSKLEMSRSAAMIAGPGIAGTLVQLFTASIALVIDAFSFLGSAVFLFLIRTPEAPVPTTDTRSPFLVELAEGFHAVWRQPVLRTMALSLCVFNFFYHMIGTVYVLYVVRDLRIEPVTLGLITTVGSFGFPIGAAFAGRVARRFGVGPTIVWGAGISDAAFLLIPLASGQYATVVPLLMVAQFLATLTGPITAINQLSLRQAMTSDRFQGRVNGMMQVIAFGTAPLGALLAGTLGEALGLRRTLTIGAIGLQLGFLILLRSPLRTLREQPQLPAQGV